MNETGKQKFEILLEQFKQYPIVEGLKLKDLPPDEFVKIIDEPREFLYNFFTSYNNNYETVDIDGNIVTKTKKRRSFNETYSILKSYYPNYSLKEFFADLLHVVYRAAKTNGFIALHWCYNIKRYVIYYYSNREYYYAFGNQSYDLFPVKFIGLEDDGGLTCLKDYGETDILKYLQDEDVIYYLIGDVYATKEYKELQKLKEKDLVLG